MEAADAPGRGALIEEIADVQEVIAALCKRLEIDLSVVDDVRRKKKESRGGFDDGRVLIETKNPRLRQAPDEPELFRQELLLKLGRRLSMMSVTEVNRDDTDPTRVRIDVPIVSSVDSDGQIRVPISLSNTALNITIRRVGKSLRINVEVEPSTEQLPLFGTDTLQNAVRPRI